MQSRSIIASGGGFHSLSSWAFILAATAAATAAAAAGAARALLGLTELLDLLLPILLAVVLLAARGLRGYGASSHGGDTGALSAARGLAETARCLWSRRV